MVVMPVEVGIWRIDEGVRRLAPSALPLEKLLEEAVERDSSLLGLDLLVLGRQVPTEFGKIVDLLALSADGFVYVIELKRDKTPREVVAQALEYGAWASELGHEELATIYSAYTKGKHLEQGFADKFGGLLPESLNEEHRMIVVASELDGSTERIIAYLTGKYGVPVNVVFFRHFEDGERHYLARSWFIEPAVAEAASQRTATKKAKEPWNGQDFYVSVGGDQHRSWEDMRRYGFISAGGGRWFWRTLDQLFPGARVFACIPGSGYVGVGMVEAPASIVTEFTVAVDGQPAVPLLKLPLVAPAMAETANDHELAERVVRVRWLKAVSREQAIWEKGMFANQNSACALRQQFTLERLTQRFELH